MLSLVIDSRTRPLVCRAGRYQSVISRLALRTDMRCSKAERIQEHMHPKAAPSMLKRVMDHKSRLLGLIA
jgi:hypothetical protein